MKNVSQYLAQRVRFTSADVGEGQILGGSIHAMPIFLSQIRLYPHVPGLDHGDTGQTSFSSQTFQTLLHHPPCYVHCRHNCYPDDSSLRSTEGLDSVLGM